jgi:hypothetical protein
VKETQSSTVSTQVEVGQDIKQTAWHPQILPSAPAQE